MFWFCVHIARDLYVPVCVYLIEWLTHWTSTFHWMNVFLFLVFSDDIEHIQKYTHLHTKPCGTAQKAMPCAIQYIFGISITSNDCDERHYAIMHTSLGHTLFSLFLSNSPTKSHKLALCLSLLPSNVRVNIQNTGLPIHWDGIFHDCSYICLLRAYTIRWLCYAFVIL